MTRQISSSTSLIYRLFIPIFWTSFWGALTLVAWFSDKAVISGSSPLTVRFGLLAILLSSGYLFWKTFWRLHRVDCNATHIFVSTYLQNVRYSWDAVEKIELSTSRGFAFSTVHLRGSGSLGKEISFLASRRKVDIFLKENPEKFDVFENLK